MNTHKLVEIWIPKKFVALYLQSNLATNTNKSILEIKNSGVHILSHTDCGLGLLTYGVYPQGLESLSWPLWKRFKPLCIYHHFQQYFSFIDGGNRSTQRKPHTCHKSLTNLSHNVVWIGTHNSSGDRHWLQ